jgi:hypothetical protein
LFVSIVSSFVSRVGINLHHTCVLMVADLVRSVD